MTETGSVRDAASPAQHPALTIYHITAVVMFNSIGFKGVRIVNTLYALELGATPFAVGLLLATYALCPLLFAIYTGRVIDRYGARIPFLGGMSAITLGVFLPFLMPVLPMLFVATAIIGAGFIFSQVATQSLTGSLGSGEARTRNFNTYSLVVAVTDLIGPVLAGFAIDHVGHVQTYLLLSAFNFTGLVALIALVRRIPGPGGRGPARQGQSAADLWRNARLRRVFILSGVVVSGIDLFQLYMPVYAHSKGLTASVIGMVLGAFAVASFVVRVVLPRLARRLGEEETLAYSIYLAAAVYLLIPFFSNPYLLGATAFALGLGLGIGQPLSTVLAYNYSPTGRSGEVLGLRIAVNNGIHVVVPVAFGAIGTLLGAGAVFWLNSACLALGGYAGRERGPQEPVTK